MLTIAIPTYNRFEKLIECIESIEANKLSSLKEVLVLNNGDRFDESQKAHLSTICNVRIVDHPINVGMGLNMVLPFYYCKEGYLWIIGDDDKLVPDIGVELESVLANNKSSCWLKFSIDGIDSINEDCEMHTLNDLSEYYDDRKSLIGNLVFVSNNIYNLDLIPRTLISKAFEFSYTHVGYLLPAILTLNSCECSATYFSTKIVKYHNPGAEFWSFERVGFGLTTLFHINELNHNQQLRRFVRKLMPISEKRMFAALIRSSTVNIYQKYRSMLFGFYLNYRRLSLLDVLVLIILRFRLSTLLMKKILMWRKG
jgi:glycosyltransferase involved in cell wall biosynthesis